MAFSDALETLVSPKFQEKILIGIIEEVFNLRNVAIKNIEFRSEQKKGDSYLSSVNAFAVQARGKQKRDDNIINVFLPIISKSLPKNIGWRNTFRSLDFFQNEVIFYNTVWKAMNEFQNSKVSKPAFAQIPLCLSALSDGINDYVALENMNYKGFVGLTRFDGLDFKHAQIILRVFARFHALGLAFKNQRPAQFEEIAMSLRETYVSEKLRDWYSNFQRKNLFPVVLDAVEKQLPELYLQRIQQYMVNDFYGELTKKVVEKGPLSVVTHGDAWAPNFLIKYDDDGVPQDAFMIDFQLSRYGSLALDLTFFLYSCTEQSLRLKHWDTLLKDYHETFVQTLKMLGSNPKLLTLDNLKQEIKSYAVFGVGMSMEAVPMAMLEDAEVANLDAISCNEVVPLEKVLLISPFKCQKKRQRIADIIKHAVDQGYL